MRGVEEDRPASSSCIGCKILDVEPDQLLLSGCVIPGRCLALSGPWFLFCTVKELAQVTYKVLPALLSLGFTLWFPLYSLCYSPSSFFSR